MDGLSPQELHSRFLSHQPLRGLHPSAVGWLTAKKSTLGKYIDCFLAWVAPVIADARGSVSCMVHDSADCLSIKPSRGGRSVDWAVPI